MGEGVDQRGSQREGREGGSPRARKRAKKVRNTAVERERRGVARCTDQSHSRSRHKQLLPLVKRRLDEAGLSPNFLNANLCQHTQRHTHVRTYAHTLRTAASRTALSLSLSAAAPTSKRKGSLASAAMIRLTHRQARTDTPRSAQ